MINIDDFIKDFSEIFPAQKNLQPWEITKGLSFIVKELISHLDNDFTVVNDIAIHKTATVESGAVLKGPLIVGSNCFIGAHAYLRGGVYLGNDVTIGPGCEIKTSIVCSNSSIAHFNFIGDSIVGNDVNFEAGAVVANTHNDRKDKIISVYFNSVKQDTGSEKFGALVGDHSVIGANAVLSPGTILMPGSVVKRLELVDQQKN